MPGSTHWLLVLFLCLGFAFCAAQNTSGKQSAYTRPKASPELDLELLPLKKRTADPHDPEQLHLALAGPGRIAISWVTWPQDCARLAVPRRNSVEPPVDRSKDGCRHLSGYSLQPTAQVGLESQQYSLEAFGSFTCYSDNEYSSGALHTVIVGNERPLLPGVRYFYRIGDPKYGWSSERSFISAPQTAATSLPYRLGLIGDLGQTEDSAKTLKHLKKLDVASVLDVGDLSYADSFQPRWDSYGRLLESHTAEVPWMHIEGNHEEEVLGGENGFVAYKKRFWYPERESQSFSKMYYSYETGPLHVIMLGCYVDYGASSKQAQWLRQDLAKVDRSRTPWLLVGMHAPWYNSNTAHQGEVDDMRDALEPILYQHGVDAVFAGHVHAYERSVRGVLQGRKTSCAPTYIVIGDGGNREGLATGYLKRPEWSEVREASFGMGVLTLQNETHALWQWHRNQDARTEVADEVWLVRDSRCKVDGSVSLQQPHNPFSLMGWLARIAMTARRALRQQL